MSAKHIMREKRYICLILSKLTRKDKVTNRICHFDLHPGFKQVAIADKRELHTRLVKSPEGIIATGRGRSATLTCEIKP